VMTLTCTISRESGNHERLSSRVVTSCDVCFNKLLKMCVKNRF
jgi:hypothetical protein